MNNEELLRPTLSEYRQPPALYNSTGLFLSAFFGGPVGAGVYASANAWRLGRLVRDLPPIVAITAAAFLAVLMLDRMDVLERLAPLLGGPRRSVNLLLRGLGIACFGAVYFMHRGYFRAARVSGAEARSGWVPGSLAVLAGIGANFAFMLWILPHH